MFPFSPKSLALAGIAAATVAMSACNTVRSIQEDTPMASRYGTQLPEPQREFRAVWVATVANIDWPSNRNLTTQQQQAEAIAILDRAKELNFNAIIFQVRPAADALYQSDIEPWSAFLTGEAGVPPDPYYDPLEFWVNEAHKRGLQLHTWFNPYRAYHPSQRTPPAENSIVNTRPDLAKRYGNYYWLDPAEPEVQQLSIDVMLDVVRRYNIDGVHMDDYFYPYKSYDDGADFPDDESWARYLEAGGTLDRDDWRRDAVNTFVRNLYEGIREIDPHVQFGISPFGIWRPGYPPSVQGLDQYSELYADARLWLNEGWVDYWTPQLYWPITRPHQSYPELLKWWVGENHHNRNVWPGNAAHSISWTRAEFVPSELINQIKVTREIEGATGNVFFSMRHFMPGQGDARIRFTRALIQDLYAKPALVPHSPWLKNTPPAPPTATVEPWGDFGYRDIAFTEDPEAFQRVIFTRKGGKWSYDIVSALQESYKIGPAIDAVKVSAVDRLGNESARIDLTLP